MSGGADRNATRHAILIRWTGLMTWEFVEMSQPIWSWAILGVVLLGLEMLTGTFYILWFGIAALCVSLLLALVPDATLQIQLLAFAVLSLTSLAVWRRKYGTRSPRSRVGQSRDDTIGKVGRITADVSPAQTGTIVFTVPVMSSREWTAIADEPLAAGETAEVVAVEGNFLRVKRATSPNQP